VLHCSVVRAAVEASGNPDLAGHIEDLRAAWEKLAEAAGRRDALEGEYGPHALGTADHEHTEGA
jgi:hypothetical protein